MIRTIILLFCAASAARPAIQAVNGLFLPHPPTGVAASTYSTAGLINAAAEKFALVLRIGKAGNLSKVHFRTGTVTTGDTLKVSFQDVSATAGDPDGTADQYRTLVVGDGDDNTWLSTGIISTDGTDGGAKRAVTRGALLAVVFEYNAYVAGDMVIASVYTSVRSNMFGQNYADLYTSSWAKQVQDIPVVALEYDDGSFGYVAETMPASAWTTLAINTGTTPDEGGLKFQVAAPVSVGGAWFFADMDGDANLVLYNGAGAALATVALDKDQRASTATVFYSVRFASSVTLTKDTYYYLLLVPTSATSVSLAYMDAATAAYLDQMDGGQNFHWGQRTDGGAFSATTTRRPMVGLVIDGIDDGVSVGGGTRSYATVQ